MHETADGRAKHRAGLLLQPQFLLKLRLAHGLPGEVLGRIRVRNERVLLGTPAFGIDPVHDPGQVRLPVAQEAFQPGAGLAALDDLARVGRRDGGQLVGEDQSRLHQADLVVELQRVGVEEVHGQVQLGHGLPREDSLIGHVVDGEDGAGAQGGRPPRPAALHDHRNQRRLPVVGMDGVGDEVPLPCRFQRSRGEQGEALVVVAVVLAPLAVQLTAVEPGVLQEEEAQPLRRSVHVDVRACAEARELHFHPSPCVPQAELLPVDRRVARNHHQDVVPALGQGPRKRADDVAEAPGLHVGCRFRSDEENLHGKTSVCRRKLAASSGAVGLMKHPVAHSKPACWVRTGFSSRCQ